MASSYGAEIDRILAKDGSDWTNDEKDKIEALMKNGQRANLKALRETIRANQQAATSSL